MSKQVLWPKLRATRPLTKGFREEIYFETTIDIDEVRALARKAAKNRTGKARDGALSVRILASRTGTNEEIPV